MNIKDIILEVQVSEKHILSLSLLSTDTLDTLWLHTDFCSTVSQTYEGREQVVSKQLASVMMLKLI